MSSDIQGQTTLGVWRKMHCNLSNCLIGVVLGRRLNNGFLIALVIAGMQLIRLLAACMSCSISD